MSMQQGRRSNLGRSCGHAWIGLENKSQEVGCKRRSEKKDVQSEIVAYQEEESFPEELHEGGVSISYYERAWCQQELGKFIQWR